MRRIVTTLTCLLIVGLFMTGCADDQPIGQAFENQEPTVWLSSAPPEGSTSRYTLHLFWGGWDSDGEISHYEYRITNNQTGVFDPADTVGTWDVVVGNDSIFTFTADVFVDSLHPSFRDQDLDTFEFQRSHTFFIRSVDEEGAKSQAVYRSFTSRTLSPTAWITVPTAFALVPPIVTFRWRAKDFVSNEAQVQEPDSARWMLISTIPFDRDWLRTLDYIRKNPDAPQWSKWVFYRAPQDSGKFWTSPPLDFGPYMFAIQAMDEAGAVTPVFDEDWNVRRINVTRRSSGPLFSLTNRFIGTILATNVFTALRIIDLPAGVPMFFEWEATADHYGGVVAGYRYGWDILDLSDDTQWDIDFTPFVATRAQSPPRTFFFGTHTFYCEVIDNSGFKSRIGVTLNIVPFTMQKDILLVDDWTEASVSFAASNGIGPSDAEHDQFWLDALSNATGFNPGTDVIELGPGLSVLPITILADYKSLIWASFGSHAIHAETGLGRVTRFIDPTRPQGTSQREPNIVALYMAAGGHVMLAGREVMTLVVDRDTFLRTPAYPMIFRYELSGDQDGRYDEADIGVHGVGEDSFAYSECCLNVLDIIKIAQPSAVRGPPNQTDPPSCPVHLLRTHLQRDEGIRTAIPLDVTTGGGFPTLELRDEVAGDSDLFYFDFGLTGDVYNPEYFATQTRCGPVAEITPLRECFEPIYGNGCFDTNSVIYNAPIAFWTGTFKDRKPDIPDGVAARCVIFGFHPVFFKPDQFRQALEIILFDEWQLERL